MNSNEKQQNKLEKLSLQRVKKAVGGIINEHYFGLSDVDIKEFEELLRTIKPNKDSNDFPDFLCSKGFIEHFAVTSSNEGRKGAVHKAEKTKFESMSRKIKENLSPEKKKVKNTFEYPEHSYADLVKSFEKNFLKHIESLEKYDTKKEIGIFLVDYEDYGALSMAELSLEGVNEINIGDLGEQEILDNYRLTRDKKMLDWLFKFKDRIDYLIFATPKNVEVIKINNIQKLQTLLPYEYAIRSNFGTVITENWIQF
ncbi:hypothetical protein [Enterococcus thailandicus]|uniref:hypothetical protein n=1 Tax=Enterococcus TaxID=1350 RepID=UPI0022E74721|nr:hypothetical protein [Enterococcus thailandicus]